jgi:hypothetical protein
MKARDFEREQERAAARQQQKRRRKSGGDTKGAVASRRMDRPRRLAGGVTPTSTPDRTDPPLNDGARTSGVLIGLR